MPLFIITLLLQILCVIHLMKSGNNKLWLTAIIFLPLAGCLAYLLIEIIPEYQGNRHVRYAKKKALTKIDPDKDIRAARERLEMTDSIANRTALADAFFEQQDYTQAAENYRLILDSPQGQDDLTIFKYATTLFQDGHYRKALEMMNALGGDVVDSDHNRQQLLRARILENLDREQEASKLYEDVVEKLPGIEPRSHYAALLLKMGKRDAAKAQFQEVVTRTKNWDRTQIGDDLHILNWVKGELSKLDD